MSNREQGSPDEWSKPRSAHQVNAVGRWVGEKLYWDIDGESISDDDLRRWCHMNLSDFWASTAGGIVNYHVAAYKHRREAIKAYLQERV